MRVVFIQKSTDRGGAKRSLAESLGAMRGEGSFEPSVIAGSRGPFTGSCGEIGVPVHITALPEWRKLRDRLFFSRAMKSAARLVADPKPDWIISNEMWWGPHAARIASHLGCRSAVILRDGIATVEKARQYRLSRNDLILAVSSTIADGLRADPALRERVHVLFNAVSVPAPAPEQMADLENKLRPFPGVGRWLLVIGKVAARKNQVDAVRLTRLLIDAGHPDLGLLLAGDIDPTYAPQLEAAIDAARLRDRVAAIGNFDGLPSLLGKAHCVLLPSFREGLPRSLVESILAGKPAFAYPCEGVEDIFGDRLPDFVSSESTPGSLAPTILAAWQDEAKAAAALAAVRAEVLAKFSSAAHLRRLAHLLALAEPKGSPPADR